MGHFWDNVNKCNVTVNLGEVVLRVPFVFRAVSSKVENQRILSWDEEAAQSANAESGFNVIPGLSLTGETFHAN